MEDSKMHLQELINTAKLLIADDKGLLAMDESNPTCNKRFATLKILQTPKAHRAYREMIVNTNGLNEFISGAILYDETVKQQLKDGTPFSKAFADRGNIPGIKVDLVHPGLACPKQESIDQVVDATVNCLLHTVPAAVPGIAFLSGGQSGELASARLNAMNVMFRSRLPWVRLGFLTPVLSSNRLWKSGMVRRLMLLRHKKPCITGTNATRQRAVVILASK